MENLVLNGLWEGKCINGSTTEFSFTGTVPGCVHTDLTGIRIPEDIYYRDNADRCQWIEEKDWEYTRKFTLEEIPPKASLVFECLDTYADIYLNGESIGTCDNMFISHRFEISDKLINGENTLTVYFHSPVKTVEGLEPCGSGVARQGGGGVARGGAGDGLRTCFQCLGNCHGAGAVFQGCRGVLTVILHPQLADTQHLGQLGLFVERAPTHTQGSIGGSFLDRQQLTVTPHGAVIPCSQLFLGEDGLNIVVIVDDVENAAAFAVGQIGGGLIGLAAADTLTVFYVFHGCFSLKKNAGRGRMPRPATIVSYLWGSPFPL